MWAGISSGLGVNVTAADHISSDSRLATINAVVCTHCGYGHLGRQEDPEPKDPVCDHCGQPFTPESRVNELYRIETVETKPVERISVNEEDRQRQGFDLITTYRFLPGPGGTPDKQEADITVDDKAIARLTYSPAAGLWRINRGWRRRKDKNVLGFYINPLTGQWSKQEDPGDGDEDPNPGAGDDSSQKNTPAQRIVPFVEDHRNLLILTPKEKPGEKAMATLQAALKRGIEQTFQIESSELVVEALPSSLDRRALLLYEAAEGGAGVLNRLATSGDQLAQVARAALAAMHYKLPEGHFTPSQLTDLASGTDKSVKPCEAGCYQCLLSYYNQPDHELIDRRDAEVISLLVNLANAHVQPLNVVSAASASSVSCLGPQEAWLTTLTQHGLRMPDQTGDDIAAASGFDGCLIDFI